MNAPERLGLPDALATLSICYAPLIDKHRRAVGTRLTMLSARNPDYLPVGHILRQLNAVWPQSDAPILIAPLDATFDESLLDWRAPANALLEIPTIALRDPEMQRLVQRARRRGIRMALRGRPDVPLPPALTACFEYSLIHIAEDRRRLKDGRARRAPPNAVRRMPFVTTGVRRVVDLDEAYERGAMASVGWPIDDTEQRPNCRLRPDQGNLMELLRVASERPDLDAIAQRVRRDPVLAFKLLRMVNSGAFESAAPVASIRRAIHVLGRDKTLRWLSLSLESCRRTRQCAAADAGGDAARIVPRAAGRTVPASDEDARDELFVAGAFSLLDRITGAAIPRLLGPVVMGSRVTDAIVHRRGPYAPHLALIEAIERSDPMAIRRHADAMALPIFDCNQALLRALAIHAENRRRAAAAARGDGVRAGIIRAPITPDARVLRVFLSLMSPHGRTYSLPGPSALSAFRAARLTTAAAGRRSGRQSRCPHGTSTSFTRRASSTMPSRRGSARCSTMASRHPRVKLGLEVLVVPRLGTISPWASKATDIAHNTGLATIRRIERGTLYTVELKNAALRRAPPGPGRAVAHRVRAARPHDRERDRSGHRSGTTVRGPRGQAAADRRRARARAFRARAGQSHARASRFPTTRSTTWSTPSRSSHAIRPTSS